MIDFIIPVHKSDSNADALTSTAIDSIKAAGGTANIVCHSDIIDPIKEKFGDYANIIASSGSDMHIQFSNYSWGENEWATIVEFDDVLDANYLEVFSETLKKYPHSDLIMPISKRSFKGKMVGFYNSIFWSPIYNSEGDDGRITKSTLEVIQAEPKSIMLACFSGTAFRKKSIDALGGFKECRYGTGINAVIRAVSEGMEVRVMPKMVYQHNEGVEGSQSLLNSLGSVEFALVSADIKKHTQ